MKFKSRQPVAIMRYSSYEAPGLARPCLGHAIPERKHTFVCHLLLSFNALRKRIALELLCNLSCIYPCNRRVSTEFGSSITSAVIRDILTEDEVILLEEEMKSNAEPQP